MYFTILTLYLVPSAALLFILSSHPIAMAIIIMVLTIILCVVTGVLLSTFLISYLLCLIYLGAMLILFVYISSLAPNEPFFKLTIQLIAMMTLMLLFIFPLHPNLFHMSFSTHLMLNKLFSNSMYQITTLLMMFLLITLLSVAHLLKLNNMPLKTFN